MHKEQQRVLLESEDGFVWPFMVMELETTHNEDHPASFNHANSWVHVWPFSEIRQEQRRALLEGKHGSFRFVWPFMSQGPQRANESTLKASRNARGSAMVMADLFQFAWPCFQIAHFRPSPQSVVIPSIYPFLQICKPFSIVASSHLPTSRC